MRYMYVYTTPNMHAKIFTTGCVLTSIYKNTLTGSTLNGKRFVVFNARINYTHIVMTVKACRGIVIRQLKKCRRMKISTIFVSHDHVKYV
jgi:hypothetical protein